MSEMLRCLRQPKELQQQRLCTAHENSIHLIAFDDNDYTIELAPFATSYQVLQIFFTGYCYIHIEKVGFAFVVHFLESHSYIFWFVLFIFISHENLVENIKV